ncbi:MAG: branched-chain amino acid ABC transporter permease [Candidatus Lustribacter sp.]
MDYVYFIASVICVWIILSVAANLAIGYGGLMSLGHVGYLAIGAYTAASLNILLNLNFYYTIPIAIVATAAVAYVTVIPLLRLGTFYFGLATLGLNIVITDVLQNIGPRVPGAEGLFGLHLPELMTIGLWRLTFIAALTAGVVYLALRLVRSPFGRSLRAMRDQPDAIESLGKSARRVRTIIWTISGALAGLAGALYCTTLSYIDPTVFNFQFSFNLLTYIGFGGLASIAGSVLGPAILIAFGEALRFTGLPSEITGPVQQSLFALLLIFVMVFRRQGLVGKYDFRE